MQYLRAQCPAAHPPAVPPHARRALRGLARGYDGRMGGGRARTAAGAGAALEEIACAASVTFPPICHAWLFFRREVVSNKCSKISQPFEIRRGSCQGDLHSCPSSE